MQRFVVKVLSFVILIFYPNTSQKLSYIDFSEIVEIFSIINGFVNTIALLLSDILPNNIGTHKVILSLGMHTILQGEYCVSSCRKHSTC